MKKSILIVIFLSQSLPLWLAGQETTVRNPVSDLWTNPLWGERFVGSYAFLPDVEPRITPEDRDLLEEVKPLVPGNIPKAIEIMEESIRPMVNPNAALFSVLGNLYFQSDNLERAREYYMQAIKEFPSFRRVYVLIAILSLRLEEPNLEDTIKYATKAIQLGHLEGRLFGILGYCYQLKGQYLSAEIAYKRAMIDDPDNKDWIMGLAQCLLQQEKYLDAKALFTEQLMEDPDKVDNWLYQANCFLGLGDFDGAAVNYEIVRRMGKAKADSLNLLGNIYMNKAMVRLALGAYLDSLKSDPRQSPRHPINAAESLTNYAAYKEASLMIRRIRRNYGDRLMDSEELDILTMEAQIAVAGGQGVKAVSILEKIISRDPLRGRALISLGQYYGETDEFEKAILMFERAQVLDEYQVDALTRHAQLMVREEKYDEAALLMREAQDIEFKPNLQIFLDQVEQYIKALRAAR